jgi:hypothetical protein
MTKIIKSFTETQREFSPFTFICFLIIIITIITTTTIIIIIIIITTITSVHWTKCAYIARKILASYFKTRRIHLER